jgi:hypothetical protein
MYNTDLNLALHFVHYVDGGAEVIHLLYVRSVLYMSAESPNVPLPTFPDSKHILDPFGPYILSEVIHLLYVLRTPYKLSRIYNL